MTKILGLFAFLGMSAWAGGADTHAGSVDPELEEAIEESYGSPEGIVLPEVQVVRFLGLHFPEMLGELEEAEGLGEEKRKEVLDRARGIILEWEEHRRVGDEVAKSFIAVERLHYQNDDLVEKYVKMEEGAAKEELGTKLRGNLNEIHGMRTMMEKAELERLKEEVAAIEENLEYSGANREEMVETEMRDLLEFWRLEQEGQTAEREREEPLIPGNAESPAVPPVPVVPAETGVKPVDPANPERIEVARPVEEERPGGGFVGRPPVVPETVEEEKPKED